MNRRIGNLTLSAIVGALVLAGASSANAGVIYSNGSISGATTGVGISGNSLVRVANSFVVGSDSTLTGVDFGAWTSGEVTSISWAIMTGGILGPVQASGSGTAVSSALIGYNFGSETRWNSFSLPNVDLAAGTYWLELYDAVTVNSGPVYWIETDGPSLVETSYNNLVYQGPESDSFDIIGTSAQSIPEPLTASLFGTGFAGVMALRRRRKAIA